MSGETILVAVFAFVVGWFGCYRLVGLGSEPNIIRLAVLGMFNGEHRSFYGKEIVDRLGLSPASVYPVLFDMEGRGDLVSDWEYTPEPSDRPRRRFYTLKNTARPGVHGRDV